VSQLQAHRPLGVTALGLLFSFGVLASGLSWVSLLTPGGVLDPIWRLNPRAHEAFSHMGAWALLVLGLVCVACAASAFGFFTARRWGYRLGIALLVLNLAGDLINAALGVEPRAWVGVPIVGLIFWYLSTRTVRNYFVSPAPDVA
jgi:hypothetical protein